MRSARAALLGLHRAEMQIMVARHAVERRHVIDAARSEASAHRASTMAAITAKYAERLARVFDSGDARSAWAARDRLRLEEAIEIAQLRIGSARTGAESRRSLVAGLRLRQRSERHSLIVRQRHQRAVLAIILHHFSPPANWRSPQRHARVAARRLPQAPRGRPPRTP